MFKGGHRIPTNYTWPVNDLYLTYLLLYILAVFCLHVYWLI